MIKQSFEQKTEFFHQKPGLEVIRDPLTKILAKRHHTVMHTIEIYGYADREICAGCEGHCGDGACAPGAKKATKELVSEFERLIEAEGLRVKTLFLEATDENLERHVDVKKILSMADLSPAFVLDGKLLFFGGFSPEGLVAEVRQRIG